MKGFSICRPFLRHRGGDLTMKSVPSAKRDLQKSKVSPSYASLTRWAAVELVSEAINNMLSQGQSTSVRSCVAYR